MNKEDGINSDGSSLPKNNNTKKITVKNKKVKSKHSKPKKAKTKNKPNQQQPDNKFEDLKKSDELPKQPSLLEIIDFYEGSLCLEKPDEKFDLKSRISACLTSLHKIDMTPPIDDHLDFCREFERLKKEDPETYDMEFNSYLPNDDSIVDYFEGQEESPPSSDKLSDSFQIKYSEEDNENDGKSLVIDCNESIEEKETDNLLHDDMPLIYNNTPINESTIISKNQVVMAEKYVTAYNAVRDLLITKRGIEIGKDIASSAYDIKMKLKNELRRQDAFSKEKRKEIENMEYDIEESNIDLKNATKKTHQKELQLKDLVREEIAQKTIDQVYSQEMPKLSDNPVKRIVAIDIHSDEVIKGKKYRLIKSREEIDREKAKQRLIDKVAKSKNWIKENKKVIENEMSNMVALYNIGQQNAFYFITSSEARLAINYITKVRENNGQGDIEAFMDKKEQDALFLLFIQNLYLKNFADDSTKDKVMKYLDIDNSIIDNSNIIDRTLIDIALGEGTIVERETRAEAEEIENEKQWKELEDFFKSIGKVTIVRNPIEVKKENEDECPIVSNNIRSAMKFVNRMGLQVHMIALPFEGDFYPIFGVESKNCCKREERNKVRVIGEYVDADVYVHRIIGYDQIALGHILGNGKLIVFLFDLV